MSIYTTRICMGTYGLNVLSILWKISVNIYMFHWLLFNISRKKKLRWKLMVYNSTSFGHDDSPCIYQMFINYFMCRSV